MMSPERYSLLDQNLSFEFDTVWKNSSLAKLTRKKILSIVLCSVSFFWCYSGGSIHKLFHQSGLPSDVYEDFLEVTF